AVFPMHGSDVAAIAAMPLRPVDALTPAPRVAHITMGALTRRGVSPVSPVQAASVQAPSTAEPPWRDTAQSVGAPPGALPQRFAEHSGPTDAGRADRWSASGWFVTRRGASAGGAMLGG